MVAQGRNRALSDGAAARLGHRFRDPSLIEAALTHPSCGESANYQRLEFLGDRVLGLIVATWLYESFPEEPEGKLNRRFTALVRRETLAQVAAEIGLGAFIRTSDASAGESDILTPAVLADVCEAVIGALYLDAGLEAAQRFVKARWKAHFDEGAEAYRDAKTALQEWVQGRGLPLPDYRLAGRSGPDHAPEFEIAVRVEGEGEARARGPSKRVAEQAAAAAMLKRLRSKESGTP